MNEVGVTTVTLNFNEEQYLRYVLNQNLDLNRVFKNALIVSS